MSEETKNSQQTDNSTPEANGGEKLFTQAELDRIVGERLKRVRADQRAAASEEQTAQAEALQQREAELVNRENRLICREYLSQKGYPADLLDVLDTSDPESFQKKADATFGIMRTNWRQFEPAPLADPEPPAYNTDTAFAPGVKHVPKPWPPSYDE